MNFKSNCVRRSFHIKNYLTHKANKVFYSDLLSINKMKPFNQTSRKNFCLYSQDEEGSHSLKNTKNKPNRLIDLNLKKSDNIFLIKMNIPMNDETQLAIFNKILKFQNFDLISDKMNFKVLLKTILFSNYAKGHIYFIVDEDETAKNIINLLNDIELDLAWVQDEKQIDLFNTKITHRFLFNYKNVKIDKIPNFKENSLLVFFVENKKNLAAWASTEEVKNVLEKSMIFLYNRTIEESNTIQSVLKKYNFKQPFYSKVLNDKQYEVLFNYGISHYAMCVTMKNISIVCKENCKKFLRLGKKVLIICDKEQSKKELLLSLGELEEYMKTDNIGTLPTSKIQENKKHQMMVNPKNSTNSSDRNKSNHLIQIRLNSELTNVKSQKDETEKYDVVIEYPILTPVAFKDRRKYLKKNEWGDTFMLSLYHEKESIIIEEMRKLDAVIIKVRNLLSSTWLYDNTETTKSQEIEEANTKTKEFDSKQNVKNSKSKSSSIKSSENKPSILKKENSNFSENSLTKISTLDFHHKLEEFIKTESKLPSFYDDSHNTDFVNLEEIYKSIQNNDYLKKQIFYTFMKQNFKKFFHFEYESISLLTGEPGWYTVLIISQNNKQMEERYLVVKFLIQQGLCTMDYEDKVFRVYEKFDHIIDIPCEKFKEFKKNAEAANFGVKILNELPIIHRNQFTDLIRHKNKFEEKVKEELDEQV